MPYSNMSLAIAYLDATICRGDGRNAIQVDLGWIGLLLYVEVRQDVLETIGALEGQEDGLEGRGPSNDEFRVATLAPVQRGCNVGYRPDARDKIQGSSMPKAVICTEGLFEYFVWLVREKTDRRCSDNSQALGHFLLLRQVLVIVLKNDMVKTEGSICSHFEFICGYGQ